MSDNAVTPAMSQPTPNSTTRKRVTQACIPCGDKKVKCDGIHPVCGPCVTKHLHCQYGVSRRNKSNNTQYDSPDGRSNTSLHALSPRTHRNTWQPHAERTRKPVAPQTGIPPTISAQLFQTYFEKIHPIWPILYKPIFSNLDFGNPSTIPLALVHAIYTISASIDTPPSSDSSSVNTVRIGGDSLDHRMLFEESLNLLQHKGGRGNGSYALTAITPSLLSCQVLAILALQQHAIAEYSRSAMLLGLASTMALNLRMHRAIAAGHPADKEIRARLWWCLYVFDKILALKLARPALLREDETNTPYPSLSESDEFELMPMLSSSQNGPAHLHMPVKMHPISGLHANIKLATIAEKVSKQMYSISSRVQMRQDPVEAERLASNVPLDLEKWEKEIGNTALKLDMNNTGSSVPSAISGYIMMWTVTILSHRPFIASPQLPQKPSEPDQPHKLCLQAAYNVCQTLEKHFDRIPGLPGDMIFSIFVSASIFLHHIKFINPADGEVKRVLKLCIHWLTVLGHHLRGPAQHQHIQPSHNQPPNANMLGHQIQQHLNQQDPLLIAPPNNHFPSTPIQPMNSNIDTSTSTNNTSAPPLPPTTDGFAMPITPQVAPQLQHASNGFIPPTPPARPSRPSPGASPNLGMGGGPKLPQPMNWSFLNNFGDVQDEEGFWALDRELIDFLEQKGYEQLLVG